MRQHVQSETLAPAHTHQHHRKGPVAGDSPRPTDPSMAVLVDVGEDRGALVLKAPVEREGLEVEICDASDPARRTHVWVLPRVGRAGTVYAAVFPSLLAGSYQVLEPDGSVATTLEVPPNQVTSGTWG